MQASPRFRWRSTPKALDQADRNVHSPMEIASKVIRYRGRICRALWSTRRPRFCLHIRPPKIGWPVLHAEYANPGILRRCDFGACVDETGHGEFHIRLPGSNPHVADKNIIEHDCVRRLDAQLKRAASFAGR